MRVLSNQITRTVRELGKLLVVPYKVALATAFYVKAELTIRIHRNGPVYEI